MCFAQDKKSSAWCGVVVNVTMVCDYFSNCLASFSSLYAASESRLVEQHTCENVEMSVVPGLYLHFRDRVATSRQQQPRSLAGAKMAPKSIMMMMVVIA